MMVEKDWKYLIIDAVLFIRKTATIKIFRSIMKQERRAVIYLSHFEIRFLYQLIMFLAPLGARGA
jgi:hypothetical protein